MSMKDLDARLRPFMPSHGNGCRLFKIRSVALKGGLRKHCPNPRSRISLARLFITNTCTANCDVATVRDNCSIRECEGSVEYEGRPEIHRKRRGLGLLGLLRWEHRWLLLYKTPTVNCLPTLVNKPLTVRQTLGEFRRRFEFANPLARSVKIPLVCRNWCLTMR